ncbi:unnamed protein product [Ectocarpus sp. 12 AP-2014]
MSTPQRGGYSSRSKGKSRGRASSSSSSRAPPPQKKQKVGTPGGAGKGVQFEAALDSGPPAAAGLGRGGDDDATGASSGGEGVDTFSYDDVSNLATVTPVVTKRSVSRAEVESSGGSATDKDTQQQQQQQRPQQGGKGKKRAAERQGAVAEGTDTEEEYESGGARRRKKRKQEAAAAAADAAATATALLAAAGGERKSDISNNSSNGHAAAVPAVTEEGGAGVPAQQPAVAEGGDADEASAAVVDPRSALSSSKEQQAGPRSRPEVGKKSQRSSTAKSARKVPRYPQVLPETAGYAKPRNMSDALKIAVAAEIKGLIRKRGKEPDCKAAVQACKDSGMQILKHAKEICADLDPRPKVDLKEVRKALAEESRRYHAQIAEEEKLWAIEEQKCLALAESTKRSQQAKVQAHDEKQAQGHVPSLTGNKEVRALLEPLDQDEEESAAANPSLDGTDTCKRVCDEIVASTNHMILNATAIGRCLQEMGSGVADAQETKERLAQVFRQVSLKSYPNVNDPKAGIAAMLK